ncbi:hypothetical protein F2P81_015215 [Scophthalmus maximus]|uniref:Uncharacterized protein n=1 Tax=Scophthalmus maximus TaxID=52904 RepID=A0A6A4SK76_SCOMX|nr:hypothetical protein F2P81_015215 [Scophthalmus maximus]
MLSEDKDELHGGNAVQKNELNNSEFDEDKMFLYYWKQKPLFLIILFADDGEALEYRGVFDVFNISPDFLRSVLRCSLFTRLLVILSIVFAKL